VKEKKEFKMARWEIRNVNIAGVAMAVPEHTAKTAEIDLFTQDEADIFDKTVGIKSRHIAPDTMCASDMCQAAGEKLLEELGWEKDSIDALVSDTNHGIFMPCRSLEGPSGKKCRKNVN